MSKKNSDIATILIVLMVIIIIIIFIATLGSIDTRNVGKIPQEFKDNNEDAKRRHQKLVDLIQKQEALKLKLDKKFKIIYLLL